MHKYKPEVKRPTPGVVEDALDEIEAEAGPEVVEEMLSSLPFDDEYEDGPTEGPDEPAGD